MFWSETPERFNDTDVTTPVPLKVTCNKSAVAWVFTNPVAAGVSADNEAEIPLDPPVVVVVVVVEEELARIKLSFALVFGPTALY